VYISFASGVSFELVKGRNRGTQATGRQLAQCVSQAQDWNVWSVAVVCFMQTLLACFIALGVFQLLGQSLAQVSKRKAL
jgi:hypothetical protein